MHASYDLFIRILDLICHRCIGFSPSSLISFYYSLLTSSCFPSANITRLDAIYCYMDDFFFFFFLFGCDEYKWAVLLAIIDLGDRLWSG
jgi:hypothetical protein